MNDESKSYSLPTETVPRLEICHHLEDLEELQQFLGQRGIPTENTRISRYADYLSQAIEKGSIDGSRIFKNSLGKPFESDADWKLYVLREVHELMWILKGLKVHVPKGIDDRLQDVVRGSDFAALDTNSHSRNIQFELRIASYFCQTGCDVDLSTETDIVAFSDEAAYYVECKRVENENQLRKKLSAAKRQLNMRMPKKCRTRTLSGIVAADVTKVAFSHNGLTFANTNEHSRDIIQDKISAIANSYLEQKLFHDSRNLHQYWFQIHIPSLIRYPPTHITRFSSYFTIRNHLNRKEQRAIGSFQEMFEAASNGDPREVPSKKLTLRRTLAIPGGTTFCLEERLLAEFLQGGPILARELNHVIAELSLGGKQHEFFFQDFQSLIATIPEDRRISMAGDVDKARFELILEMFALRYPFEEDGTDAAT